MLGSMERRAAPLASDGAWLLLEELNHRVCNELQVALSALRLARRGLASAEPERFIEEAVLRLEAFGCVQQLLDRQREQGSLAQRLEALCRATSRAKAAPQGIHLTLKLEDVTADEETAWTVCVVASELMTNAFKHAFAGSLPGVVSVVLRQDGEEVLLKVTDNGVGAAAARRSAETIWQAPGFGSGIVAQLAERLNGLATRVSGSKGTTATFRVPAARSLQ
jgi:two-component system, sensor histidine kinase PdtaS